MKNILLDLSSIKSGGGLQLAINFINNIKADNIYLLINEKSKGYFLDLERVIAICPNNLFSRFYFENFVFPNILLKFNIDIIYTFFGSGLPRKSNAKSVVGVAYPIICYPDSDYWKYVPIKEKIKKIIWNYIRVNRLKNADIIICETEIMKERVLKTPSLCSKKILVFPPTVTNFLQELPFLKRNIENFNILVLGSLGYHKNNWRLYDLCFSLKTENINFCFNCSFSKNDFISHLNSMGIKNIDVSILNKYFKFLGVISPNNIQQLYNDSNILLNISDLESFSNNYMEAWKTSTLLVCSNRDFSKSICRNSAIYCEPHDIESIKNAVLKAYYLSDEELFYFLENGKKYLSELPTLDQKNKFIENILMSDI